MKLKSLQLFFILLNSILIYSQDMQEGFTYLETGKYAKAETFFQNILQEYPNNKTARLCYGRAIGLNGKTAEANTLFINLLSDYPNDFEVKLNYGESLLWNKDFSKAKTYFKSLIDENPNSFAAQLSYANTLSNLKEFENALIQVNKALEILPGNPNALTSKKYIYLGYAYQKQQAQLYDEAEVLLKENLKLFNNDRDTLLNLANLYLIANKLEDAKSTYQYLSTTSENKVTALNGLALVSHLNGKEKDALNLSTQAFESLNITTDSILKQQTTERYLQALIWNKKYKLAELIITNLIENNPKENWVIALRATLNIYKSNFKESVEDYNLILVNDSTSFDGNLGKANALKALGYFKEAYKSAENTLLYYDNQKDAINFINTLNISFTPFYEVKSSYTFDNGDNKAYAISNNIEFPISTAFKYIGQFGYRNTINKITNNEATSKDFSLGVSYQILSNLTLKGLVGLTNAKTNNDNYSQLLTDISFNVKPFKLQVLDIGYKREIQNFNAELLNREIVMNNFYTNYNLSTNFNLGWFAQYFYTTQNDDNVRNLFFTSFYYNLLNKPSMKTGLNYQYITFKNQVNEIYFSPSKFNAVELFYNIIKDEMITDSNEWYYELTAASGYQFIENEKRQITYRFQGKLGYKISDRSLINIYGAHSNIASATASGFTFTEFGLRFKWLIVKDPIFRKIH